MPHYPECSYTDDGYLEAVIFIFSQGDQILIENRLDKTPPEPFLPNGKIDLVDKNQDGDYKVVALRREITEEFGDIEVTGLDYLGEYKEDAIKVMFYIYLVTSWSGEIPDNSYEEGKVAASLEWVTLEEASKVFAYPVLEHALALVEEKRND